MRIIENVPHGTIEWHEWRRSGLGSSDIPAIMGTCPFRTPEDVYNDKFGVFSNVVNKYMQRGIDFENEARNVFMRKHYDKSVSEIDPLLLYKPLNVEHEENPMFKASLDGYCHFNRSILEIKVPGRKTLDMAAYKQIPVNYMMQIQWQLYVTGAPHAFYFCYNPDSLEAYCIDVFPDIEMIDNILLKTNEFVKHWQSGVAPEPKKKVMQLEDSSTQKKLKELLCLKEQEKKIKLEYQSILEELLEEVGTEESFEAQNIILSRMERSNYDYRQAAIDAKVNLEEYKKPVTVSWTIKKKGKDETV